jgi:hypothetical protein
MDPREPLRNPKLERFAVWTATGGSVRGWVKKYPVHISRPYRWLKRLDVQARIDAVQREYAKRRLLHRVLTDERSEKVLVALLKDPDPSIRLQAARTLRLAGDELRRLAGVDATSEGPADDHDRVKAEVESQLARLAPDGDEEEVAGQSEPPADG